MPVYRGRMVHLPAKTQYRSSTMGGEDNLSIVPEYAEPTLPANRVPVSWCLTATEGWLTVWAKASRIGQSRAAAERSSPGLGDATSEQSCIDHPFCSTFAKNSNQVSFPKGERT